MKNSNLFLLVAALFAFVSCGTANLTAQWGASQYRNGIYYSATVASNVQTAPAQQYVEYAQVEPEPVAPAAVALAAGESFEDRLRKFDSPVYVVNVEYVDLYPWWTLDFAWNSHSWRWYHSWYTRPYVDWYWADSWWYNRHWYNSHWYNHHWYDRYWYGHHWHPHYSPVHYPSHNRPHQPARNVYYGKRDYSPSYRDAGRGAVSTGSKSPMGNPSGSVTRRPADSRGNASAVKGQPAVQPGQQGQQGVQGVQGQQGKQGVQGQPQYRRTTGNSGSGNVKSSASEPKKENVAPSGQQQKKEQVDKKQQNKGQQNRNQQNEYRRSSSSGQSQQYNRSSSYSSGRSSYGNYGGGGSRSGGSSSGSSGAYRRR